MATQTQLLNQTLSGLARLRDRAPDYCELRHSLGHDLSADHISFLASASESEDALQRPTNRGNKLKRKAYLMHEGQIYSTDGPATYKPVSFV